MNPINDFDALPDVCAYCGVSPAPTTEHVIPRAFRAKADPEHDWILVHACEACNRRKAGLDDQVRNLLALHQDSRGNPTADSLVDDKITRSMLRLQRENRTDPTLQLLRSMKPIQILESTGAIAEAMIGQAEKDVFTPWLEYVAKGLTNALWHCVLSDVVFEVKAYESADFEKLLTVFDEFEFVVRLGNHTQFSYDPVKLDSGYGLWIFRFYGGIGFTVLAVPPALKEALDG